MTGQITKEAIEAAKSAYWTEVHHGGGYSDKCYEAALTAALPFLPIAVEGKVGPDEETYQIGVRDGYSQAVQQIDRMTGGDGEYRYCTDHDPERHTPGPAEMIQRIVDRFEVLNLLDDATKTGRDQEWGISSPGKDGGQEVEELRREIASLQYRLDEANGHLRRFEEGQEVEAKRWLVEETLPSGSVRWSVFEHEHQAKLEAAKATATITPLFTHPQTASTALVEKLEALERGVRATSDSAYIASLNKFSSTPCLGWEAKVASGEFGKDEMEAHAEANKLMGKHQGLAEALKLIRSALGGKP